MMGTNFNFDSTVDSLMDRRIGGWNVALIRSTFSAKEADVISKIPICPSFPLDCLVWQGTKNGSFSVHSAYHLGKVLQQRTLGECSSLANYSDIWKVIWSLRVPNLVKVFMWRACHNLLPTNLYLFKQKVVDSNLCPCCEKEELLFMPYGSALVRRMYGIVRKAFLRSVILEGDFLICWLRLSCPG